MGGKSLSPGIYDQIITELLDGNLKRLPKEAFISEGVISAELPDRLSLLVERTLRRLLNTLEPERRLVDGPQIINRIVTELIQHSSNVDSDDRIALPLRALSSVGWLMPDGTFRHSSRPLTPLADTTVLTGARGEPTLLSQLQSEIPSADEIEVVVAFIRQTGIRPLLPSLSEHVATGKPLRVLTSTYAGVTERRALDLLSDIGAEVRVSYDTSGTRLHAKAWLFRRNTGLSTAYVGSSNLTFQAQITGLEWNVRLSALRNPDSIGKLAAVFESYWSGGDFSPYHGDEFEQHILTNGEIDDVGLVTFDLAPHPFQRRMLEQLSLCREEGRHRNLVVSATGTGKTVLSAFDYQRLRSKLPSSRLLFIAHRQEILEQSMATFRHVLREPSFGELWVGGHRPRFFNHVFASIQTLSRSRLEETDLSHFDVVIVDEFHHAAAKTYRNVLEGIQPSELLGLTATPERSDGASVLEWFDDQIAVEFRLWDAIEQQRLVPFVYYGVDDESDLTGIPRRGREYDPEALGLTYQSDARWVRNVLRETKRLVPDHQLMRGLGFCASVSHAAFTASAFNQSGIPSAVLAGNTPQNERRRLLAQLRRGEIRMIFSVDVLSEGVDLPDINTVLFLRPTESATVFLQQLGRGLRKAAGKDACLVLDFIGAQASGFRFDLRYRALFGGSRTDLAKSVREGFPYLPAGCQMNLDYRTSERILQSLRDAIPTSKNDQLRELARLSQQGDPTLVHFLDETGLDIADIYRQDRTWMTLRLGAGLDTPEEGVYTAQFRRAMGRLMHLDDPLRLSTYAAWLDEEEPPALTSLHDVRLMRMLLSTLTRSISDLAKSTITKVAEEVWLDKQARADLKALISALTWKARSRGYPVVPLHGADDTPLRIHARYTRDEILCAVGSRPERVRPPTWQSGVWFEDASNTDLLAFTLDKSAKSFSPSTRYRDYAISDRLIHWESQGATRENSETGQRYVNHASTGSRVYLFARESVDHRSFWFLGPGSYVDHEGERPMAITWRLHVPLPDDIYGVLAAAA